MNGRGRRRAAGLIAAAVVTAGALAGCGGDSPGGGDGSSSAPSDVGTVTVAEDGVQEITLQTQDDYVFVPDRFTVDPGKVRLTVVNVAEQMTHNLEFDEGEGPEPLDAGISLVAPGEEEARLQNAHLPKAAPGTMSSRATTPPE